MIDCVLFSSVQENRILCMTDITVCKKKEDGLYSVPHMKCIEQSHL